MKTALAAVLFLLAGQVALADQACTDQCWQTWDDCAHNCGDFWSCDACDQQRDQCLNYCASCPSTRDYSTTVLLSAQQQPFTVCVEDYPNAHYGCRFTKYNTQYRRTNYRETTNCDGTKTTTVLSSSTFPGVCVTKYPSSCTSCSPYSLYNTYDHCPFW